MAGKGPPRTPTTILQARGSRLVGNRQGEPQPPNVVPRCPDHLDEEAKREWQRITRLLRAIGMAAQLDRAALAAYCLAWSDHVRLTKKLRETGDLTLSQAGEVRNNPLERMRDRAEARLLRWVDRFGLAPSARARLAAREDGDELSEDEVRFFGTVG